MQNELSKMVSEIEEMIDPDVMSEEELQGIVGKEIEDAMDYIDNLCDSHVGPDDALF